MEPDKNNRKEIEIMNNFIISSYDVENRLLDVAADTERAHWSINTLYRTLLLIRSNKKRCCSPSFNYLVERLGMARPTLSRCIKVLEENGFLFVIRKPKKSSVYFMPLEDYYLKPELLDNYANTIKSLGGSLMEWDKYRKEFLK